MLHPKWFQEFHPMGGVSPKPLLRLNEIVNIAANRILFTIIDLKCNKIFITK